MALFPVFLPTFHLKLSIYFAVSGYPPPSLPFSPPLFFFSLLQLTSNHPSRV